MNSKIAKVVKRTGIGCYSGVRMRLSLHIRSSGSLPVGQGPTIRFMRDNINKLGGDIHNGNVRCRRCTTRQSGGFDPNYGIQICANELRNKGHLEDTLAHGWSSIMLEQAQQHADSEAPRNGTCI